MPLYDYQCKQCQTVTEVRHGFNDAYTDACAQCGGTMSRVFNPAGIVFKGSGFYITDSRKGGASADKSGAAADSSNPAPAAPAAAPPAETKKSDAA